MEKIPFRAEPGTIPEIFSQIERLSKKLKRIEGRTLRAAGLTPPQYIILSLLTERDGRAFKELAEALFCTRASVTGIVDSLEKNGFAARAPNPADRRSGLVMITEKGRQFIESTPTLEKAFTGCCGGLDAQEAQQLSHLLKKLNDSLHF
jgi:DNA-binding MarR family transcriptional regulator